MKWPARLHEVHDVAPEKRDSKLVRWLERARLGNRWAAASADATDDATSPARRPSDVYDGGAAPDRDMPARGHRDTDSRT